MKKGMAKLLSLALAVLMLVSVFSVSSFAFSSDYITIECPENFDETDYSSEEGFYVDVYYDEWYTADDGAAYYTGNTVEIYAEACWDDTIEDYYDESNFDFMEMYLEDVVDSIDGTNMAYATFGGYDAVVYEMYYTYTGQIASGERKTVKGLYSEIIIVAHECCVTVDIDVMDVEDLIAYRNEIAETFLSAITYNDEAIQQAEADEKNILMIGLAVVGVFLLIGLLIVVVIIVAVSKSSKRKKAQRTAPQYNPYGNNPNMQYNPYGQYNPNGQAPTNNGQYVPYGQPSNTYNPYTPAQPAPRETKDPLDLDNK